MILSLCQAGTDAVYPAQKNTAAQRFHCAAVFHKSGSQKIKLFSGLGCLDLLDELRHDLEQIADDAVICHTEDGSRLAVCWMAPEIPRAT